MNNKEIWKAVKGYEGFYEVSNYGRIRSVDRTITDCNGKKFNKKGKILSLNNNAGKDQTEDDGYWYVYIQKDGKRKHYYIHVLVAEHFIDNDDPENKVEVNHIDEDKSNNRADNLEWCTREYNANYGTKKERAHQTKLKNGSYEKLAAIRDSIDWKAFSEANGHKYILDANKKRQRKIKCITTGEIFDNSVDAAKYAGLKHSTNITACCKAKEKGKHKTAGKLSNGVPLEWEYYEEE